MAQNLSKLINFINSPCRVHTTKSVQKAQTPPLAGALKSLAAIGLGICLAVGPTAALAKKKYDTRDVTNVPAEVLDVYDGDTFTVHAYPWPGIIAFTKIRLLNLDTPEKNGDCPRERDLALKARDRLIELLGDKVYLHHPKHDKYGGRTNTIVSSADGKIPDISKVLIEEGHARAYDGGKKSLWCTPEEISAEEERKEAEKKRAKEKRLQKSAMGGPRAH